MRNGVLFFLACFACPTAQGQPSRHRLSLGIELGWAVGGPGSGLERQLRDAGYDETSPCFPELGCSAPTAHPTRENPGGIVGVTLGFAIARKVALAAGYSNVSLGGSIGYAGSYILSDWDASMIWISTSWRPRSNIRLGAGPGWYRLENVPMAGALTRIGAVLEAGLENRTESRLFLSVTLRMHVIPAKDVDHGGLMLRPHWTHAAILAGAGVRL
jgi:hypothetical protein